MERGEGEGHTLRGREGAIQTRAARTTRHRKQQTGSGITESALKRLHGARTAAQWGQRHPYSRRPSRVDSGPPRPGLPWATRAVDALLRPHLESFGLRIALRMGAHRAAHGRGPRAAAPATCQTLAAVGRPAPRVTRRPVTRVSGRARRAAAGREPCREGGSPRAPWMLQTKGAFCVYFLTNNKQIKTRFLPLYKICFQLLEPCFVLTVPPCLAS